MTRRAGVYARISRDADGEGLGVARQESDCRALAGRLGWDVVAVYVDNDISATSGKPRPEWSRLIRDLDAGTINAVVAYHPTRMYRAQGASVVFGRVLRRTGAECETVTGGRIDVTTATGRMNFEINASIAAHEAGLTSERRRRAADQAADDGKPGSGPRAFGYAPDGLTVIPEEADIVRRAAEDVLNGVSARTVVRGLNVTGAITARGKPWTPSSLRAVLTGYRVAGRRQRIVHDGCEWVETPEGDVAAHRKCSRIDGGPARWDPILDGKTWNAIRAWYAGNDRPPIQTRRHLLAGIAVCGTCGEKLAVKTKSAKAGSGKTYVCPAEKGDGKRHAYIARDPFEEIVSRWSAEAVVEDGAYAADPSTVAREVRDALAAAQRDLDELARARYVEKVIDDSQFVAAQKPLRARQAELEAQIDAAESEARSIRASVSSMFGDPGPWDAYLRNDFAAIRADIETKVARVVVSPGGRGRPAKPEWVDPANPLDWRDAIYRQRVHDRVQLEYRPGVIARR